jgi:RimJ/RimL family protein N-acetyltransferase
MKTTTNFLLSGQNIFLRPLAGGDASEEYARWLNDPVVNRFLETRSVTVPELEQYIEEKNGSDDALLLGIFWKNGSRHIGNIKLEPIDREKKTAVLGILIGNRDYWGKGAATEATNLLTDFAFRELGMKEVTLGVIKEHASAIRVYEKCGFVLDRIEKNALDHDGVSFDRVVMRKSAPAPLPHE